jgi:hypothetical protein
MHATLIYALLIVGISIHEGLDDDAEEVFRPAFDAAAPPGVLQVEVQAVGQEVNVLFIVI